MDEMAAFVRRLDVTERNQSDLARSVTELVKEQHEMNRILAALRTDKEVNAERDISRNDRFDRLEKRLDAISKLGWWVLATFGSLTMAAVANILFGGINVP